MTAPDITYAIARARDVYDSVPNAGQVLDYLEAVMAAEAEALAATDWRDRALKYKAALINAIKILSDEPAAFDQAAAKMGANAERMAALAGHVGATNHSQTRMDAGDEAATSPVPSMIISTLVVKIDTSAIDAALAKVDELKVALASVQTRTSGVVL